MSEEGWLTNPDALLTLVQLGGVQVGDELQFVRHDGLRWQGVVTEYDETTEKTIAIRHIHTTYAKLSGSVNEHQTWTLTGWRRP